MIPLAMDLVNPVIQISPFSPGPAADPLLFSFPFFLV
jgi:hypothetical protein